MSLSSPPQLGHLLAGLPLLARKLLRRSENFIEGISSCSSIQVFEFGFVALPIAFLPTLPLPTACAKHSPHQHSRCHRHNGSRCAVCRELFLLLMVLSLPLRQRCRPIDCATSCGGCANYVAVHKGWGLC